MMSDRSRAASIRAGAVALAALVMMPNPAHAYVAYGFSFGPPAYYYPPPAYYYPPPVVYAPPPPPVVYDPTPSAQSCDAGAYQCPLEQPSRPGDPCSCPTNRGRVTGAAR